jgi:hypothetical protein
MCRSVVKIQSINPEVRVMPCEASALPPSNTWSDDEEESEESGGEDDDFGIVEAVERADLYRNDGIDEYVDLEN